MAPIATEAARTWRRRGENGVDDMMDILRVKKAAHRTMRWRVTRKTRYPELSDGSAGVARESDST
jgi:hypothetical protein